MAETRRVLILRKVYRDALQHTNLIYQPSECDAELRDEAGKSINNVLAYISEDNNAGENNVDEEQGEQGLLHNVVTNIEDTVGDDTSRN